MAGSSISTPIVIFLLLTISIAEDTSRFVVLVDPDSKPSFFPTHRHWYSHLLSNSTPTHVYQTLIHGFSATLTLILADEIRNSPGILTVHPDYSLHPHTTRSPSFLRLDDAAVSSLSNLSRFGSDVIIGVIDTGIWPESPSFSDRHVGKIPAKWRGRCQRGFGFNRSSCNRKIIGARYFSAGAGGSAELLSPRDTDGHGTHVASIAAGSPVLAAGFYGLASGTSRGMAPNARIAAYKVCWSGGCLVSDVVAVIDVAVSDGVDVISLSLGSSSPAPSYSLDPLAIATFRAAARGVFIAASAGNGGPHPGSVANSPPWITTVGSGTIDRDFLAVLRLGDGELTGGRSISIPPRRSLTGALVTATNLTLVKGHIVILEADRRVERIAIGAYLKSVGAIGMIIFHGNLDREGIVAEPHVLPTVAISSLALKTIKAYIKNTKDPTAVIFSEGTDLLSRGTSPLIAAFSSRGPNPAVPWVLKPDLVAPGVNILGAWTGMVGPSGINSDHRRSEFNVLSGTSMACPHVAGVAALIRAARPEWDPSDIRSALMTTAVTSLVDELGGGNADPFGLGAGYIDPNSAVDPGLVYDLESMDYAGLLCGLKYKEEEIRAVGGRGMGSCRRFGGKGVWGFNYPGFVVEAEEVAENGGEVVFYRRLKRVDGGGKGHWYTAEVVPPLGYDVEVGPERLWFGGRDGERLEFRLVLRIRGSDGSDRKKDWWVWGMLRWREEGGMHIVKTPIVAFSKDYMPSLVH